MAEEQEQQQPTYPIHEDILDTYLKANGTEGVPQSFFAIGIILTDAVITAVQAGELTWEQFIFSEMTPEQLEEVKDKVAKAHSAFLIDAMPKGKEEFQRGSSLFSYTIDDHRLINTWRKAKDNVMRNLLAYNGYLQTGQVQILGHPYQDFEV